MKKTFALLLVLVFIVSMFPSAVLTDSNIQLVEHEAILIQDGATNPPQSITAYENKMFGILSAPDLEGAYQALYDGLKNRLPEILLEQYQIPNEQDVVVNLYSSVVNNNGDLFYLLSSFSVLGYIYKPGIVIKIIPNYNPEISQEEIDLFNKKVEYIISKATGGNMSTEDKVLAVHDYIVDNCEYDYESYMSGTVPHLSYTAYGTIVNQIAVCQGYSLAYNYILKKLGVQTLYATSYDMDHGWSMVLMDDGNWYHVDATWDDPVPNRPNLAYHYYFLLSDETIADREHYGWDSLPECSSKKYESGYLFNQSQAVFHYREGLFWFEDGSNYYYTDFTGKDKTSVSEQDYIIIPKTPYTIYYPIVYDDEDNVIETNLNNIGNASIAIDRHNSTDIPYLFIAYYADNNKLIQISNRQIQFEQDNFTIINLSETMPIGANKAKLMLWDESMEDLAKTVSIE